MIKLYEPFRGLLYTPFYLVHTLGAYEAEGVSVQLETAPSPAAASVTLLEGRVDVAWGGPMRVQHHYERDPACDLVLFGEAVTRDPFILVGRDANPEFTLSDLADFRLATVSEVPTPWLCLQEDLRRAGIDPQSQPRVADGTMTQNAAALREGKFDVIQVFEPFAETLTREGVGHIWEAAAGRGHTAYTSFYATWATLGKREDELQRMVRALYRTQRWLQRAGTSEVGDALCEWFPELPREILDGAIGRYRNLAIWNENPVLSREGFERLIAGLLSGGWIERSVSFEQCVDTRLARQAIEDHSPRAEG